MAAFSEIREPTLSLFWDSELLVGSPGCLVPECALAGTIIERDSGETAIAKMLYFFKYIVYNVVKDWGVPSR